MYLAICVLITADCNFADHNFADCNFADHNLIAIADCNRATSASVATKFNLFIQILLYMKCVEFSKGGQKMPQICFTRLGF